MSRDGRRAFVGRNDGSIRVVDLGTGKTLWRIAGAHGACVVSLHLSKDESLPAPAGAEDRLVRLWGVEKGEVFRSLEGHGDSVSSVRFSGDGTRPVSTSREVIVWDVQSGDRLGRFQGHAAFSRAAGFSPDGSRVASGGEDGSVRIWDVRTGVERSRLKCGSNARNVYFSKGGGHVPTALEGGDIQVWDVSAGEQVWSKEPPPRVLRAAPAPPFDLLRFATFTRDRQLHFWSALYRHRPERAGHTQGA